MKANRDTISQDESIDQEDDEIMTPMEIENERRLSDELGAQGLHAELP